MKVYTVTTCNFPDGVRDLDVPDIADEVLGSCEGVFTGKDRAVGFARARLTETWREHFDDDPILDVEPYDHLDAVDVTVHDNDCEAYCYARILPHDVQ